MADSTTTQFIKDHARGFAVKLTNISDGTGESEVTKLDASTMVAANDDGSERLTITKLLWSIYPANTSVTLLWQDDGGNTDIATLTGNGVWDLSTIGSFTNDNANTNGDILLTTNNFTETASYTILLEGKKVAGYTSREVTDDGVA